MFRIRRIHDDVLPINKQAIAQVEDILRDQFPDLHPDEAARLSEKLRNPFKQQFRTVLFVAEKSRGAVKGFALLMHDPELRFSYLDYLAIGKAVRGRGIGAAVYERLRQEALGLDSVGIFFECLPDDPAVCPSPAVQKLNGDRLRFYEAWNARPIVGTAYESPLTPGGDPYMPYLVFDGLDRGQPLSRSYAKKVVRAILERKYADLCSPEFVKHVLASFRDDPVRLREPRYLPAITPRVPATAPAPEPIAVFVNDKHNIHHVRERGYVEAPARINAILRELEGNGLIENLPVKKHSSRHILAVHDRGFYEYFRRACANVGQGKSVYPYVFPIRNVARPPREWSVRAGYYCIDTFTPINGNAFPAASRAVDCALSAADEILDGRRVAYALVRPPGHHAERGVFGGFCYFNNAAIAAHYLTQYGRIAILDVDYHHGNGQQDIFWQRSDVLTVSIHGSPVFAYPYFSGFAEERGEGEGEGLNKNYPLPEIVDGPKYRDTLAHALKTIGQYDPDFLIVALGLDTAKGDPTGTWMLRAKDLEENGRMIGRLDLPTLVVQEGGYRTRTLGVNARSFFRGLVNS